MKQRLLFFLLLSLGGALLFSCSDDDVPNPNVEFTATLNGANERPTPTSSTATGTATLTYNTTTKIFTIVVTFTGLTATNGHIHKGAVDASGSPVFAFASFTSPITYTSVALTDDQETDLYAALYYVNLHSAAFPGGEIRGQLIKQ